MHSARGRKNGSPAIITTQRTSLPLRLHPSLRLPPTCKSHVRPATNKDGRTESRSATAVQCFLGFSSSSVPIDALVSPSAYPVLIHPTQRAENGCKCIFLKGQSQPSDGRRWGAPTCWFRSLQFYCNYLGVKLYIRSLGAHWFTVLLLSTLTFEPSGFWWSSCTLNFAQKQKRPEGTVLYGQIYKHFVFYAMCL